MLALLLFTVAAYAVKDYIVLLKENTKYQERKDINIKHLYSFGYLAAMEDSQYRSVKMDADVEEIEEDINVEMASSWGLERISTRANVPSPFLNSPTAGQNVTVYVLDTGIRLDHVEFGGRVSLGATFTGVEPSHDTHGTHVASIIGGNRFGIARKAQLVSVEVLQSNYVGNNSMSKLLKGIDWVKQRHEAQNLKRSIMNLSIGSRRSNLMNKVLDRFFESGVLAVVAASNNKKNACFYSPASCSSCLTVAASDEMDRRASFSNFGSCVDLFAPGTNITAASNENSQAVTILSGTSMAAPHVTGVAANIWSFSDYSVSDLRAILLAHATKLPIEDARGSPERLVYNFITAPSGCNHGDSVWLLPIAVSVGMIAVLSFIEYSKRSKSKLGL